MKKLFIGAYFGIAICFFVIMSFLVVLGGKAEDMWQPFVYSILWPILIFKLFYAFIN